MKKFSIRMLLLFIGMCIVAVPVFQNTNYASYCGRNGISDGDANKAVEIAKIRVDSFVNSVDAIVNQSQNFDYVKKEIRAYISKIEILIRDVCQFFAADKTASVFDMVYGSKQLNESLLSIATEVYLFMHRVIVAVNDRMLTCMVLPKERTAEINFCNI